MKRLTFKHSLILSGFLFLFNLTNPAFADSTQPQGNRVSFSISEMQNVPNDIISMTFNRVAEGISPQAVANEINRQMQSAIKALKPYPDIIVKTSQYSIQPVYTKKVISHWRGQQSLVLTLENKPGLVKVLTKIQPYLAYQSMQFGVSDALKHKILGKLTDKAILQFRDQASRIAHGFNVPSFKILETRINTPNSFQPRPMYANSEMAMMSSKMAAPVVEAGQSQITVNISGTILLPY
ncbi:SIMPL domain-containing protein [Thiomicrorhabdus sp.]|uniref:SIMPL domain-containing protein n=1 Tax=Thiomicrorhabdus sp. TaxID=2039724 RepID=UPI002AA6BDE2|nr:SIMPL domain-containing protein [Thiomicrorhabdus sp.]